MKKAIIALVAALLLLAGCKNTDILKPNCSGASFELLWVINNDVYQSEAGDTLRTFVEGPVPFLPQPEPQFRISRIEHSMYDNLLKTTRNILFVTVDPERFTQAKIKLCHDLWAQQQAVCYVNAPDRKSLTELVSAHGDRIVDFFVEAERNRTHNYYLANLNREANQRVYDQFDCNIAIPTSLNKFKEGDHFLWISNGSVEANQNIVLYTVPYHSTDQLTDQAILARRDSVMKANIPGQFEGSYMGTELKHLYPETKIIEHNGEWAAVTRGLWRMQNGASMGGPFVSLTRIDKINKRIVTAEGFVFAPGREKRNLLRQMDAMVYSLLTPQDLNRQKQEQEQQAQQHNNGKD